PKRWNPKEIGEASFDTDLVVRMTARFRITLAFFIPVFIPVFFAASVGAKTPDTTFVENHIRPALVTSCFQFVRPSLGAWSLCRLLQLHKARLSTYRHLRQCRSRHFSLRGFLL
ncbi:MAG: hypothetical protein L7V87_05425, partial [Verrucomicrobiales bacterium]|nr:hypothetical protein [Verrucomicrobiales bacterium]